MINGTLYVCYNNQTRERLPRPGDVSDNVLQTAPFSQTHERLPRPGDVSGRTYEPENGEGIRMNREILFTVEKKRVLVPVGEPCVFGCRYCYTRGGEVGGSRVSAEEILSLFQQFTNETQSPFDTIQFGYDSDPFSDPERGISMLKQLATMHKHVNFSTKAALKGSTLDALSTIQQQMAMMHTTLSALVSLSCWDSAPDVEPHTPRPHDRMLTVAHLTSMHIPVFIALRPILPHIPDSEYERIVDEGIHAGCEGFILGPLYVDARGQFARFIPPTTLEKVPNRTGTVSWSAHAPVWKRYEDTSRLQRLLQLIQDKGGRTFLSSADAMALVQQEEAIA